MTDKEKNELIERLEAARRESEADRFILLREYCCCFETGCGCDSSKIATHLSHADFQRLRKENNVKAQDLMDAREKHIAELEAACREKDERIHELWNKRDERLAELTHKSNLQMQQILAQNEYYVKVIAGEVALQLPAPILIDNGEKVTELEATVARLEKELADTRKRADACAKFAEELNQENPRLRMPPPAFKD